jgi:hypothetical protein
MLESNVDDQLWLYLWTKRIVLDDDSIVVRVCFGITSNYEKRTKQYEGANGHSVKFCDLWKGPSPTIRSLEGRIKTVFSDHLVVGYNNFKYEWLMEDITLDQIKNWINWEITQKFPSIEYDKSVL